MNLLAMVNFLLILIHEVSSFGAKDDERISLKGTVEVQCVKGKNNNGYFVGTPDVLISQKVGGKRYEKAFPGSEKEYSVFFLNRNGRLQQFINSVKPDPSKKVAMVLYNIRKTVASFYQMDTRKGAKRRTRIEISPEGEVRAHYNYNEKRGLRRIVRRVASGDVIKKIGATAGERKRDTKFRLTTTVLIKDVVGTSENGNKNYDKLKQEHPEMRPHSKNHERAQNIQNAESASRFMYKNSITRRDADLNTLTAENGFAEDLSMSQATLEFALQAHKENLEHTTDYVQVLKKLQQNPKDLSTLNKALEYTKTFAEKSFPVLLSEYKSQETAKNVGYQKVLHTLLAATQLSDAEKVLLEAMKNSTTTQSAMTSLLHLQAPSDEVVHTLQAFSEEKSLGLLSNQAYLLFAHMASKTQNKLLSQHIVGHIAMNMHNVQSGKALRIHIKALANAGEAVPLSVLEKFIYSQHVSLDSKIDAAHALQHRVSGHENDEVTALVHKIVNSEIHEEVKAATIHAQSQREKVLEDRASLHEFRKLEASTNSARILTAISNYYEEADVAQTNTDDEDTFADLPHAQYKPNRLERENVLFFRKIGRAIKRGVKKAVRHVKKAARHVKRHVKKAARHVKKHLKKAVRHVKKGVKKAVKQVKKHTKNWKKHVKTAYRAVKRATIQLAPKLFKKVLKKAIAKAEEIGKKVGKFVKKVANAVKNALEGLIKKAKKFFKDLKDKVATVVTLESLGRQCVKTSQTESLCSYNKHYISYVGGVERKVRFSNYQSSNHYNLEKVFGIRLLYVYFGSHAFTSSTQPTKCSDNNLKFVALTRTDLTIGLFGRRFSLVSADAYISVDKTASGSKRVGDQFRLSILEKLHLWDMSLIPDKMKGFEYCNQLDFAMIDESFDFFTLKMTIMAGPIPITFSFGVTGSFAMNYNIALCGENQIYSLEVEPEFTIGPTISAGIGVAVFSGGVSGELVTGIGLSHHMAHTECNRCVQTTLSLFPLTFTLSLYLDLLVTRFERTLFSNKIPGTGKSTSSISCMNQSKKDDWEPEEGVTPSPVLIQKMPLSKNLLVNLATMSATQKVWIKVVNLFLKKFFEKLSKSGRKGKGGKPKGNSQRRSKGGNKKNNKKKTPRKKQSQKRNTKKHKKKPQRKTNDKKTPRKKPMKKTNTKKQNKNKKNKNQRKKNNKKKRKDNKKEKKEENGSCSEKAQKTYDSCIRITQADICQKVHFASIVKCSDVPLQEKCLTYFKDIKHNPGEGEEFCTKFSPKCETSGDPSCKCTGNCQTILKLLGTVVSKASGKSSRKSSRKSSGNLKTKKNHSTQKNQRQQSKKAEGFRKGSVIKIKQHSRKPIKPSKRTVVATLSVEKQSVKTKSVRRNF